MSSNAKTAKRGDFLFREGDKITSLVLIQKGGATLTLNRAKRNMDIFPVGASQVLGEQAFAGVLSHNFSLVAANDVQYLEIPMDLAKQQVEAAPQFLKILIKSMAERLKVTLNDVKSSKLEKDASPCPEDQVAKIYGAIYHTAQRKAKPEDEKNPNILTVDWVQLKQYCQRIFGESPRRIEQAINLLVKLKTCSYTMGKPIDDSEGADEIQKVNFLDLGAVEAFFEFYQYYYFKGGAASIIKFEESAFNLVSYFLKMVETVQPDRFGVVTLEFTKAVEYFKSEFNLTLNAAHFSQLEAKGIFAKRVTRASDNAVMMSFEVKEWQTTQKIWRIIREIDKWNEKGFVDMNEEEVKPKKKSNGPTCPSCSADVSAGAKFCQECGAKIEAQTAAPGSTSGSTSGRSGSAA